MKVVISCDHGGYKMAKMLKEFLKEQYEILDLCPYSEESVDYPDFAHKACKAILNKEAELGILICGTGIGMSISANRFKGIRAGLCHHSQAARLTRQHNDANILCLGGRMIGDEVAKECAKVFLETKFEGGRHVKRLEKVEDIK